MKQKTKSIIVTTVFSLVALAQAGCRTEYYGVEQSEWAAMNETERKYAVQTYKQEKQEKDKNIFGVEHSKWEKLSKSKREKAIDSYCKNVGKEPNEESFNISFSSED